MPGFLETNLNHHESEEHEDGSFTWRYDPDGEGLLSLTYSNEGMCGTLIEEVRRERNFWGHAITVTYDGDGKVINEQDGWGDDDEDE